MGAYPSTPRSDFVAWCAAHVEVFSENASSIGISAAQATAFQNATEKAISAISAAEASRIATQTAIRDASDAVSDLRAAAGNTVRIIRAFAETAADPEHVYSKAQFPPPAPPSPVGPPGQPTDLRVELEAATGVLTLRWKCTNPASGTSYLVRRRLAGESDFSFLGVTGSKKFIDTALLAGPDMVQYTVQGQRSDLSGPLSEIFTVNFGQNARGGLSASVREGAYASTGGRPGDSAATSSTVDGRIVQKVLPSGNGHSKRGKTRA